MAFFRDIRTLGVCLCVSIHFKLDDSVFKLLNNHRVS
jgi:hypothetical protein